MICLDGSKVVDDAKKRKDSASMALPFRPPGPVTPSHGIWLKNGGLAERSLGCN